MTTSMTNVRNVEKLNDKELQLNLSGTPQSWHYQYRNSAWIFIGGLSNRLTEGDIIIVFSQYGEVVNINLVRDKINGASKGYCFLCYEDQRSTILAVENLNNIKIDDRTLRVDHVENYKIPELKESQAQIDLKRELQLRGCAPDVVDEIRELERKKRELEAQLKQTENEDVDLNVRDSATTNEKSRSQSRSHPRKIDKKRKRRSSSSTGREDNSPPPPQRKSERPDQERPYKSEKNFQRSSRDRKYSGGESTYPQNKRNFEYNRNRSDSGNNSSSNFVSKVTPRYGASSYSSNFTSKPRGFRPRGAGFSSSTSWSSGAQSRVKDTSNIPKSGDYREIIEKYRASMAHQRPLPSSSRDKFRYNRRNDRS